MRRRQPVVVVPPELVEFDLSDWPGMLEFPAVTAWRVERALFEQAHPGALDAAAVS